MIKIKFKWFFLCSWILLCFVCIFSKKSCQKNNCDKSNGHVYLLWLARSKWVYMPLCVYAKLNDQAINETNFLLFFWIRTEWETVRPTNRPTDIAEHTQIHKYMLIHTHSHTHIKKGEKQNDRKGRTKHCLRLSAVNAYMCMRVKTVWEMLPSTCAVVGAVAALVDQVIFHSFVRLFAHSAFIVSFSFFGPSKSIW